MKAIVYRSVGDENVLEEIEVSVPKPKSHDLLIEVKAVSVNPVDYKIRSNVPPDVNMPKILGYDASGIVTAIGDKVTLFNIGDEVYYSGVHTRQGSNAEFQLVDERITAHKPASLTWVESAALPLTTLTAWELLFERMRIPVGIKQHKGVLLVINGAGGVGSILIQLARKLTSLTVIATASRPESSRWAKEMGAHYIINHHEPISTQVRALGIFEVDFVAGLGGTQDQIYEIAEIIKPQGTLALIDDGSFDIAPLKQKSITIAWEMIFTKPLYNTEDILKQHNILEDVSVLIDAGVLKTTLTNTYGHLTVDNLKKAHRQLESSSSIGKIALEAFIDK